MDPYSAEGELINIHNHFHQGQYQEVVDFDTSALSAENQLPARVLQLRARIALGQAAEVLHEVSGEKAPELQAVAALAEQALGNNDKAVDIVQKLAAGDEAENVTVQIIGGTVLQAAGKSEEALALLNKHQGSCMLLRPKHFVQRVYTDAMFVSGCCCTYCPDLSSTEPERPCR